MEYFDIHTHSPVSSPDHVIILNNVVYPDKEFIPDPSIAFQSVGIHPWYIKNVDRQLQLLESAVTSSTVVAIGESGLDKLADVPLEQQKEVFLKQALLAEEVQKPVIIHCVKAWDELFAIKKKIRPEVSWIIHGFRGKPQQAQQLIEQGFHLSFGEFFHAEALLAAWPDRLFAETDEKNLSIEVVYNHISSSMNIPIELVVLKLRENVRQVFSI